ncbi:carboxypeptidase-like regulatory domain-containing protein [Kaistella polysaccharea]|uniref:carboxypeptidase-like regulatory domain-containing protein n=1 Tax=Kaistella polysaccharea TaxID=2878534 RepID=UPI001CF59529|nr:carboxypeptidase-like regulatory domain-containing protein [Kaistella polysaccharea]
MKIKYGIFFALINFFLNAQIINGKIQAKIDKEPISFARVGILDENFGVISNGNGEFSIDLTNVDKKKNLVVQFGGYENYSIKIQNINSKNFEISLNEKVQNIQAVILKKQKFTEKNWGSNSHSQKILFAYYPERTNEDKSKEIAVYFGNNKKVKINKINVNVAELKADQPLQISFNIYSLKDKLPFESIVSENLTAILTNDKIKDGVFTFDISDRDIWVEKEDFFVSMQVLNSFGGYLFLSGSLFHTFYKRDFYSKWDKMSIAEPSINIDVKILK